MAGCRLLVGWLGDTLTHLRVGGRRGQTGGWDHGDGTGVRKRDRATSLRASWTRARAVYGQRSCGGRQPAPHHTRLSKPHAGTSSTLCVAMTTFLMPLRKKCHLHHHYFPMSPNTACKGDLRQPLAHLHVSLPGPRADDVGSPVLRTHTPPSVTETLLLGLQEAEA